jgi:hypothetical protein
LKSQAEFIEARNSNLDNISNKWTVAGYKRRVRCVVKINQTCVQKQTRGSSKGRVGVKNGESTARKTAELTAKRTAELTAGRTAEISARRTADFTVRGTTELPAMKTPELTRRMSIKVSAERVSEYALAEVAIDENLGADS